MKRVIIGAILAFLGIIWKLSIFTYVSNKTGMETFLKTVSSENLTLSLIGANSLLVIGLIILTIEYFRKGSGEK
ncbi:MAG: hypothetical protein KIC94_05955 [Clostridiales bacterium]|nr:hypothetical protein [uncultured Anaerosporobacter sp.]MBS5932402.1 hypothetical protein [Clostridiales bacterium]